LDRYLASLRASAPTYEDPYAYWGGARPALQYRLPPEQPRPAAGGFTVPLADYGMGHTPAGMPPMGGPPPINTGPGGPRPSTPGGTILPSGGGGEYTFADPAAQQRYGGWLQAADAMGAGLALTPEERQALRDMAAGGIAWAGRNEPGRGAWAQDPAAAGAPDNTLNPQQALSYLMRLRQHGLTWGQVRGRAGGPFQGSGRADVGGNATDLTSVTPAGAGAPEDAGGYVADWRDRAAAHVVRSMDQQGAPPMADQSSPTYHGTPNNQPYGVTGAPAAGGGAGGGGLSSYNAGQLLFDPAALQAYIAQQAGTPVGRQTFRDQYTRQAIVPLVQSALESLTGLGGETSADQLGQNLQHYLGLLRGQGGFGAIRGEATAAMGNPELWSNLGLLSDQEAAQRLNQLIGLGTVGTNELFSRAIQARAQNALTQRHVDQAMLPPGADTGTYADYFRGLPWLQMLGGGR
jgi:hypothetical protein